jgi:hypothetical protein
MSQISESLLTGLVSVAMLPALTLVHELGHGLAALLASDQPVVVTLGKGRALRVRLGRLTLCLRPSCTGRCQWHPARARIPGRVLVAAAGPLASTLTALSLAAGSLLLRQPATAIALACSICAAIQGGAALIPRPFLRRETGVVTDGECVLQLLRSPGHAQSAGLPASLTHGAATHPLDTSATRPRPLHAWTRIRQPIAVVRLNAVLFRTRLEPGAKGSDEQATPRTRSPGRAPAQPACLALLCSCGRAALAFVESVHPPAPSKMAAIVLPVEETGKSPW